MVTVRTGSPGQRARAVFRCDVAGISAFRGWIPCWVSRVGVEGSRVGVDLFVAIVPGRAAGSGSGRPAVASCREAVVCDGTVPLSAAALTSVKMESAATGYNRIGRLRKGVNGSGERRS